MLLLATLGVFALLVCCVVPYDRTQTYFIGALIGAGASLIGGALNRKSQKDANEANSPEAQVQGWKNAGINPAFGISKGQWIPQQAASMGDSFARAGSIFGEALERDHAQKLEETKVRRENKKLREELDKLANPSGPSQYQRYAASLPLPAQGVASPPSIGAPAGRALDADGFPVIQKPFVVKGGSSAVDRAGNPTTALSFGKDVWKVNDNLSDAEVVEVRYGDIAQEVAGLGNFVSDAWLNSKPAREAWLKKRKANQASREALDAHKARIANGGQTPVTLSPKEIEFMKSEGTFRTEAQVNARKSRRQQRRKPK